MSSDNVTRKEFVEYEFRVNRYRWPIVLLMIVLTIGLMVTHKGLSILEFAQSILLVTAVCFFSMFDFQFFSVKKLQAVPDIIKIACLTLLVMIFGYWGLVYTGLFLIILIIDAFNYSHRDFVIVLFTIAVSVGVIWWFQNDEVFKNSVIKNTFFLVMSNLIFALAILLRILARESLSMNRREEALELNQKLLKEENAEMNAIFNNMENAIFSLDKDNNIFFANKSAINIFPILKGKINRKIPAEKITLADSAGKTVTLKEIADSSNVSVYRSDLTAKVNDKVVSFNSFVTKIFDEKNDYQGAMISLHSLSADEMLEKSRMEFASLASHEIRTPLTVIEGYLSLMLTNDGFVYNDLTKEYLTTLHDTTTDLIKLSNGILSMSKIDEGSVRVDIVKTDLSEVIKNIVSEQIKLAKSKGLDIQYELNKVPVIDTDKTKINEILRNLIENAIKFSTKGIISVILDQQGSEILISVEDSGIGIPESSKNKIFSKFYQAENWDTRKVSGTGLGLYVSKSMAKRIGGDLVLETTSKKGSKFTLILPVKYPILDDLKKHKDIKLKEFIEGF